VVTAARSLLGADGQPMRGSMAAGAYEASSFDLPDLKMWTPPNVGPNAAVEHELDSIVSRTRDIDRNNGLAKSGIQTTVDNVVGVGYTMQSRPDYKALGRDPAWARNFAEEVERLWRPYASSENFDVARMMPFPAMTRLVFRTILLSGSAVVIPYYLRDRRHRTCFMAIEPDRLATPSTMISDPMVKNGVRYNAYGEAITYYVMRKHPGEIDELGGLRRRIGPDDYETIPARTRFGRKRLIHVFDQERPAMRTGVPLLTSCLRQFRMLDRYQISELQAAVVNSMVAAFIETDVSPEQMASIFGGQISDYLQKRNEWQIKFQGGSILNLFPGTKLNSFMPSRPNQGYGEYVTNVLRHVASSLNMPYELLVKDFSQTNYSSARAALLEGGRYFVVRRKAMLQQWANEVYKLFLEEKILRGEVEDPGWFGQEESVGRARWIGPGRGWIDPVKEAEAARMRMEIGLSTLADECAEQGVDWEEIHEQRVIERDRLVADGFTSPMLPQEAVTERQQFSKDVGDDTRDPEG
jgi:lambda family phage portal protein